jgi:hypothetical protein
MSKRLNGFSRWPLPPKRACVAVFAARLKACPDTNRGVQIAPLPVASLFVNPTLLSLQAACHLFVVFHLPSARVLPSIQIESRPAGLVMTVTDF